ncbi:MAG: NAD(P)-binding protein [Chloroflexi bacterium]|nr:NAD(P)-binding protein [Chloroflexota bacterium]
MRPAKQENNLSMAEKKRLGLDRPITRRDFMKLMAVGAGALLLSGCTDSSSSQSLNLSPNSAYLGGNTKKTVTDGHRVRNKESFPQKPQDTGEIYDLVVVGAGLGGLTAAYFYHQERPEAKILLLDNHSDFGGDAQRNEMTIKGQRIIVTQGCDYQWDIDPEYSATKKLWDDLGIDLLPFEFAPEAYQDHMFINGKWVKDFWETGYKSADSPWPKKVQADYEALFEILENFKWTPWPRVKASLAKLDKISFKEWIEDVNGFDPRVTHLVDMWVRSDFGAGVDTLSAAGGLWNYSGGSGVNYKWPGGMSGFARHLVNALIPEALNGRDIIAGEVDYETLDEPKNDISIRLESTVVEVKHEGSVENSDYVLIKYMKDYSLHQLKAKSVIMAGGGYITKHIVKDLPQEQKDAYDKFSYSAYMVANVWVNNSRALDNLNFGYSGGIWEPRIANYITVADGITEAGNAPNRDPERPNCITLWCPQLPDPEFDGDYVEQSKRARENMLRKSFEEFEILIRQELLDVFGDAGFDLAEDIEGIAINRWGHAEIICYPGFAFGSGSSDEPVPGVPIYDAGKRFGRIAFAHTDLNGIADNQGTTRISRRAVDDLLER